MMYDDDKNNRKFVRESKIAFYPNMEKPNALQVCVYSSICLFSATVSRDMTLYFTSKLAGERWMSRLKMQEKFV
jgi:hypothetical protein